MSVFNFANLLESVCANFFCIFIFTNQQNKKTIANDDQLWT